MTSVPLSPPSPPQLDPPYRGYIETTFDALLVFEAARRGMIPRVTRRLIERERGMVQSGAVFVFDEHESGIKRWTDGLIWSPSRILGNFLVYRETDKKSGSGLIPMGPGSSSSPSQTSPSVLQSHQLDPSANMTPPAPLMSLPGETTPLGQGALRPRSSSDAGALDRQRERQLVGSLTNSYKFKDNGLVKKTMSVTVNGYAQHMISYYSIEDVLAGKLRAPSSIPELAALEISPEYLHKQNFRFPPQIELGPDGIPRYRGEPEEPTSPSSMNNMALYTGAGGNDMFDYSQMPQPMRLDQGPSARRNMTVPMAIPISPAVSTPSYAAPGSAGSTGYFGEMSPLGPSHVRPGGGGAVRPGSSRSGRYDPYAAASPRPGSASLQNQSRRVSAGQQPDPSSYYAYDIKPVPGPNGQLHYPDYNVYGSAPPLHPMAASPIQSPASYPSGHYAGWQAQTPSRVGSIVPRHVSGPISAGDPSSASGSGMPPGASASVQSAAIPGQQPPHSSPPSVFQAPAPPPHDWTTTPSGTWDTQGAHLHGPGQYQPPPPSTHSHYQAPPPPPHEWRDGASMAS